jgi:hypothetical protein
VDSRSREVGFFTSSDEIAKVKVVTFGFSTWPWMPLVSPGHRTGRSPVRLIERSLPINPKLVVVFA